MSSESQLVEHAPLVALPLGPPTDALPAPSGLLTAVPMPAPVGVAQMVATPPLPAPPLAAPTLAAPTLAAPPLAPSPLLAPSPQLAPSPLLAAPAYAAPGPTPLIPQLPELPSAAPMSVVAVDGGPPPVDTGDARAPSPAPHSSRRALVFGGLSAMLVAGVIYFTVVAQTTPDNTPVPPVTTLPIVPATPVQSPLLEPITDSRELVDQINSNDDVINELYAEAGIEPVGEPGHGTYVCSVGVGAQAVPGYEFTTLDMGGTARRVVVDAETGDFAIEADGDGVAYRSVDGQTFIRSTAGEEWKPVARADIDEVLGFGLVGLVVEDSLVPSEMLAYATFVSNDVVDGRRTTIHDVDIERLRTEAPAVLAAWVDHFGIDTARIGLDGDAPLRITVRIGDDGIVHGFEIVDSLTDQSVTYAIDTIFDTAPTISL